MGVAHTFKLYKIIFIYYRKESYNIRKEAIRIRFKAVYWNEDTSESGVGVFEITALKSDLAERVRSFEEKKHIKIVSYTVLSKEYGKLVIPDSRFYEFAEFKYVYKKEEMGLNE